MLNTWEAYRAKFSKCIASDILDDSSQALFVIDRNNYDLLFLNTKGTRIIKALDEVPEKQLKCYAAIMQKDHPCADCPLAKLKGSEFFTRDVKGSSGKVYQVRAKEIAWDGKSAVVEYFSFDSSKDSEYNIPNLLENLPGGVGIFRVFSNGFLELDYMNEGFYRMLGDDRSDREQFMGFHSMKSMHKDDVDYVKKCMAALKNQDEIELDLRLRRMDGYYVWFHLTCSVGKREKEYFVVYVMFQEIDERKQMEQKMIAANNRFQNLMTHSQVGIVIYRYTPDNRFSMDYVSDGFCDLAGSDRTYLLSQFAQNRFFGIGAIYHAQLKRAFHAACASEEVQEVTCHVTNLKLKSMYLSFRFKGMRMANGDSVVYGTVIDVTDVKEAQQKAQTSQQLLEMSTEFAGLWTFTFSLEGTHSFVGSKLMRDFELPAEIDDFPEAFFKYQIILPESIPAYRKAVESIREGSEQEIFDVHIAYLDGSNHWVRMQFNRMDVEGVAAASVRNIDDEKVLQARMDLERNRMMRPDSKFTCYDIINLSNGIVMEQEFSDHRETGIVNGVTTVKEMGELYRPLVFKDDLPIYNLYHDVKWLKDAYLHGKEYLNFEFRLTDENGVNRWQAGDIHLVQNPATMEILNYEYYYDIHDQKAMSTIMNSGVNYLFDRIGVITPEQNQMTYIQIDHGQHSLRVGKYNEEMEEVLIGLSKEEQRRFQFNCSLNKVVEQLEKENSYEFTYHTKKKQMLRIHYAYTGDHRYILISQTDVTELMKDERVRNEQLQTALDTAERATAAKSDFLARMSHDLRTPMNVIIGLSSLTIDDCENPQAVRKDMSQMRSASDYMLRLINDILDMAKIEEGSMVLNREPYGFDHFFLDLTTMFQAQCQAKGIELVVDQDPMHTTVYTDPLRLNQIFNNLLSNSVKYTPEGGRIQFSATSQMCNKDQVQVTFTLSDNGIGMSKEFLDHMFEPFSQENTDVTAHLTGSGLGLSIAKQLVECMGGSIEVQSEKGVGTTTTIQIVFDLVQSTSLPSPTDEPQEPSVDQILEGVRVLMAEDHPLNTQIAIRLLEKKKVHVTHAENGRDAVHLFAASALNTYDCILMDIRMPVMDGLQATREIRALDRIDAKTVPILAMSANAYEEDVQKSLEAGMNEHLAKPINPAQLYERMAKEILLAKTKRNH